MIFGVYGVGYAVAATAPLRHWPIVLVGLLGKLFGPVGFIAAALGDKLPWTAGAEERLKNIPEFVRPMARSGIEKFAREEGYDHVDEEVLDRARDFFGM